ncbi:DUF4270 family protein [Bacteroidota bacterium]
MIWQGRRKLGLIITILALYLFSCEEASELGLELDPDKNKVGLFYKELILPTAVINTDSLETDFSTRLLVGAYRDDNFGEIKCTAITQVRQNSEKPYLNEDDEFDSLVFMVDVNYNFGSNIGFPQKYYLHRLEEQLTDTISYYSFSDITYSDQTLGENEFIIEPDRDTVLIFRINDDFGLDFFNTISDTTKIDWDDNDSFIEYFRGLALVADNANNSVIGFPVATDSSVLKLYYSDADDTVSSSYDFILNGAVNFNQILSDKTGTLLEPITDHYYEDFIPADERMYLQAGSGIVYKIDMQPLVDFGDSIPNLIINSSAIEFPVISTAYNVNPPEYLHFYFTDSTNRRIKSGLVYRGVLQEGTSNLLAMNYSEDLYGYNGRITSYSEDLIRDIHNYSQLLVYPTEFDLTQAVNQLIIQPGEVKLRIYYTALKDPALN